MCREGEPTKSGYLNFTHVGCPKSAGGQQEAQCQNLANPLGESQVQRPVRIQLSHKIYQYNRSLVKNELKHKDWSIISPQGDPIG